MPNAEYDSNTTIWERVLRKTQLFVLMSVIGSDNQRKTGY
jgi:hypothetical protein